MKEKRISLTEKNTIRVDVRKDSGKGVARKLRAVGKIPGVLYGHKCDNPVSLVLDPDLMYELLTTKRRKNIVFRLEVDGTLFENVMVKEYQIDPVRRNLLHADLISIDPSKSVHVTVPAETVGQPIGVKQGGRLQMVRTQIPVRCLPNDIPLSIPHNVARLGMGQSVLASQLRLPKGVEADWPVDFAVLRIAIPRGASLPASVLNDDELEELEENDEIAGIEVIAEPGEADAAG